MIVTPIGSRLGTVLSGQWLDAICCWQRISFKRRKHGTGSFSPNLASVLTGNIPMRLPPAWSESEDVTTVIGCYANIAQTRILWSLKFS
jgi:hypothetical protein